MAPQPIPQIQDVARAEILMTPDINLGDLLTNSPQYAILAIVIWAITKLGPILLKLAVQIEKMNDIIERLEKK